MFTLSYFSVCVSFPDRAVECYYLVAKEFEVLEGKPRKCFLIVCCVLAPRKCPLVQLIYSLWLLILAYSLQAGAVIFQGKDLSRSFFPTHSYICLFLCGDLNWLSLPTSCLCFSCLSFLLKLKWTFGYEKMCPGLHYLYSFVHYE